MLYVRLICIFCGPPNYTLFFLCFYISTQVTILLFLFVVLVDHQILNILLDKKRFAWYFLSSSMFLLCKVKQFPHPVKHFLINVSKTVHSSLGYLHLLLLLFLHPTSSNTFLSGIFFVYISRIYFHYFYFASVIFSFIFFI